MTKQTWRVAHEPHLVFCDHCHARLGVTIGDPCEAVLICESCIHNTSEFLRSDGEKP